MALVAPVENGKIVETESQSSLAKKNETAASDGMDKDSFLQLLVAQMQYQDPLEPTSNTEYIAQYAQFSQVEALSNMASAMELTRASNLVGQEVYIRTSGSDGETKYIQGKVDYVTYQGGEAYLSIDDALYSLDDLDSVVDREYQTAYDLAYDMTVALNKLPSLNTLTISDRADVQKILDIYDGMTDYQKTFVASDTAETIEKYRTRLEELIARANDAASRTEQDDADEAEDTDPVEQTDGE